MSLRVRLQLSVISAAALMSASACQGAGACGFKSYVLSETGPDAVDCGVFEPDGGRASGFSCVTQAFKNGQTFYVVFEGDQPTVTTAVIRTTNKKIYFVRLDTDPSGTGKGGTIIDRTECIFPQVVVVQTPYEIIPGTIIDAGQEVLNCQAEGPNERVCG
jgi:hypothetical protein